MNAINNQFKAGQQVLVQIQAELNFISAKRSKMRATLSKLAIAAIWDEPVDMKEIDQLKKNIQLSGEQHTRLCKESSIVVFHLAAAYGVCAMLDGKVTEEYLVDPCNQVKERLVNELSNIDTLRANADNEEFKADDYFANIIDLGNIFMADFKGSMQELIPGYA